MHFDDMIPAEHRAEAGTRSKARRSEDSDGAFRLLALREDSEPAYGFAPIDWEDDSELLIAEVLALHRVPALLAERILEVIRHSADRPVADPIGELACGLAASLSFSPVTALLGRGAVALVGPPGAGKTTLAVKLAAEGGRGRPVLLNTDGLRRGAQEQLAEYAEILGAGLESITDAEAIAQRMRGRRGRLIIDTSGVNPFDDGAMRDLASLVGAARAEPVLVLPANIEPGEAVAVAGAFRLMPIQRLLVTRLDIVRRLGGTLAAAEASGCDLVAGSVTPHFSYGLQALTPPVLARRLMSAAFDRRHWQID